jgi:heterodisulfide reductase subunit C
MSKTSTATIVVEDLDPGFREEVASMPGGENITKCFQCGTCAAGCPVTSIDEHYNSRSIIRKILYGMREEVLKSKEIWLCVMCYRCYARCPQQVNFTDIMRALRHMAVRDGFAPAEMLAKEDEVDKKAHILRHDLVSGVVAKNKENSKSEIRNSKQKANSNKQNKGKQP